MKQLTVNIPDDKAVYPKADRKQAWKKTSIDRDGLDRSQKRFNITKKNISAVIETDLDLFSKVCITKNLFQGTSLLANQSVLLIFSINTIISANFSMPNNSVFISSSYIAMQPSQLPLPNIEVNTANPHIQTSAKTSLIYSQTINELSNNIGQEYKGRAPLLCSKATDGSWEDDMAQLPYAPVIDRYLGNDRAPFLS